MIPMPLIYKRRGLPPMAQKLTLEVLKNYTKTNEVTIPAFDANENDLIVDIKRVQLRDVAAKVQSSHPKIMKQVEQFRKKYDKYKNLTKEDIAKTVGMPAFIAYEDIDKISPYIQEILHQGLVTPTYQDILNAGIDLDFIQKQILFVEILAISNKELAELANGIHTK